MAKRNKPAADSKHAINEEVLLGVDYGESRIGLAFGRNGYVSPLKIISGKNDDQAINEISQVVIQNKITKIIIGLPKSFDGKDTPTGRKIQRFGKLLKIMLKKPVEYVDESFTSVESSQSLIEQKLPQKSRLRVDDISAALILRNFYQSSD